ncbi:hypothetical protein IGI37_003517 [Enterococcus sp. AZ194]|uniref:ABC transporter permease n=1 Tax=Enterococcus sp. AZ194 TaxID=2774629 RepID=UPI003F24B5AE
MVIEEGNLLKNEQKPFFERFKKNWQRNKIKYLMVAPVIIYFLVFSYKPMYGIIIAFKDYKPHLGILGSRWVGLENFKRFFSDPNAFRVIKNTFIISMTTLIIGFPAPIILALLINEVKSKVFKRIVQTITYMPYFISLVVMCSLIKVFTQSDGLINDVLVHFGIARTNLLANKTFFIPIYVISGIWQNIGWNSIIYLAALSGIDQELYEAVKIDGAGRFKQMWHVTLPGIRSTIIILLVLRIGGLLSVGFEKVLLLYSPSTYQVADVISTYVYRMGILNADFSYSTAIGLFNTLINVTLLLIANRIAKKTANSGLF